MLFPVKVFNGKGKFQYEISAHKILERHNKILRENIFNEKCYTPKNNIFYCSDCGSELKGANVKSSKLCKQCVS